MNSCLVLVVVVADDRRLLMSWQLINKKRWRAPSSLLLKKGTQFSRMDRVMWTIINLLSRKGYKIPRSDCARNRNTIQNQFSHPNRYTLMGIKWQEVTFKQRKWELTSPSDSYARTLKMMKKNVKLLPVRLPKRRRKHFHYLFTIST